MQDSKTVDMSNGTGNEMDNIKLRKALQGYAPADVDRLIDSLRDEIERLQSLNEEHEDKNNRLIGQNQDLKEKLSKAGNGRSANTESLLQIVDSARTTADQILTAAQTEAKALVENATLTMMDAEEKAKSILDSSESESKETLSNARGEAQSILRRANTEATETVQSANDEARDTLSKAKTKAREYVDEAQLNAAAIRNKVDNELSGVSELFTNIMNVANSAQGSLTSMFAEVVSKSSGVVDGLNKVPSLSSGRPNGIVPRD